MAHTCSTLLVHCMDFRFVRGIRDWMEEQGVLGGCDVIAVPGVAKVLADPQMLGDADFLLRAIGIGVNLHAVRRVILLNHSDCGAYGGARAFVDAVAERKLHVRDLKRAAAIIRERFPHVTVDLAIASLRDGADVAVESIESAGPQAATA